MTDKLTDEEWEALLSLALRAIHDDNGRGMVGAGRNHVHQRVARAILAERRAGATALSTERTAREEAERERDAESRRADTAKEVVTRIWAILGNPSYEQLAGRSIYDLITELQDSKRASEERVKSLTAERDAAFAAVLRMVQQNSDCNPAGCLSPYVACDCTMVAIEEVKAAKAAADSGKATLTAPEKGETM